MEWMLTPEEVRVLGSLVEKEITTPEYYPLSLNALANACNQKSNREPVMALDEEGTAAVVDALREKRLVAMVTGAGGRVPKYKQLFVETVGLDDRDTAVLCELMIRGPQTAAQLRAHAARLRGPADPAGVEETLQGLMAREPRPLVVKLPRQPGHKEARYAHLLCGAPQVAEGALPAGPEAPALPAQTDRIDRIQDGLDALRAELDELRRQFDDFKRQFTE